MYSPKIINQLAVPVLLSFPGAQSLSTYCLGPIFNGSSNGATALTFAGTSEPSFYCSFQVSAASSSSSSASGLVPDGDGGSSGGSSGSVFTTQLCTQLDALTCNVTVTLPQGGTYNVSLVPASHSTSVCGTQVNVLPVSAAVTVDLLPPIAELQLSSTPTSSNPYFSVTIVFSEPVQLAGTGLLQLQDATLLNLQGSGRVYTAKLRAVPGATAVVTVAGMSYTSVAGGGSGVANSTLVVQVPAQAAQTQTTAVASVATAVSAASAAVTVAAASVGSGSSNFIRSVGHTQFLAMSVGIAVPALPQQYIALCDGLKWGLLTSKNSQDSSSTATAAQASSASSGTASTGGATRRLRQLLQSGTNSSSTDSKTTMWLTDMATAHGAYGGSNGTSGASITVNATAAAGSPAATAGSSTWRNDYELGDFWLALELAGGAVAASAAARALALYLFKRLLPKTTPPALLQPPKIEVMVYMMVCLAVEYGAAKLIANPATDDVIIGAAAAAMVPMPLLAAMLYMLWPRSPVGDQGNGRPALTDLQQQQQQLDARSDEDEGDPAAGASKRFKIDVIKERAEDEGVGTEYEENGASEEGEPEEDAAQQRGKAKLALLGNVMDNPTLILRDKRDDSGSDEEAVSMEHARDATAAATRPAVRLRRGATALPAQAASMQRSHTWLGKNHDGSSISAPSNDALVRLHDLLDATTSAAASSRSGIPTGQTQQQQQRQRSSNGTSDALPALTGSDAAPNATRPTIGGWLNQTRAATGATAVPNASTGPSSSNPSPARRPAKAKGGKAGAGKTARGPVVEGVEDVKQEATNRAMHELASKLVGSNSGAATQLPPLRVARPLQQIDEDASASSGGAANDAAAQLTNPGRYIGGGGGGGAFGSGIIGSSSRGGRAASESSYSSATRMMSDSQLSGISGSDLSMQIGQGISFKWSSAAVSPVGSENDLRARSPRRSQSALLGKRNSWREDSRPANAGDAGRNERMAAKHAAGAGGAATAGRHTWRGQRQDARRFFQSFGYLLDDVLGDEEQAALPRVTWSLTSFYTVTFIQRILLALLFGAYAHVQESPAQVVALAALHAMYLFYLTLLQPFTLRIMYIGELLAGGCELVILLCAGALLLRPTDMVAPQIMVACYFVDIAVMILPEVIRWSMVVYTSYMAKRQACSSGLLAVPSTTECGSTLGTGANISSFTGVMQAGAGASQQTLLHKLEWMPNDDAAPQQAGALHLVPTSASC